jgi:hypothetical protein
MYGDEKEKMHFECAEQNGFAPPRIAQWDAAAHIAPLSVQLFN